jgi:hypothetical protein
MAIDNIILNKTAIIERCIIRIQEEYQGFEDELATNHTRQDSIILNLLLRGESKLISIECYERTI